jgi:hypothetical protein
LSAGSFERPVPSLLAYPPRTDFSPWPKLFIGYSGIVGEVVEAGITVRIFHKYEELGLGDRLHTQNIYACGNRGTLPMLDVISKMQAVAQEAAAMNAYIPDPEAPERVALILIFGGQAESRYVLVKKKGAVSVSEEEVKAGTGRAATAHEVGHAIYDYHIKHTAPGSATPDALGLRIADVFVRAKATPPVPRPTKKFDPAAPPSLSAPPDATTDPAGIIMVFDTLWSGSGGHPWDDPHEFFASAVAGFVKERVLFEQILKHYETADSEKIAPLRKELLELLAIATNPAAAKELAGPQDPAAAAKAITDMTPTQDISEVTDPEELQNLVDPSKMKAPKTIPCLDQKPGGE